MAAPAAAPVVAAPAAAPVVAAPASSNSPVASPVAHAAGQTAAPGSDVDQGRARQLLDRALLLEERGDMQGAILACRQSVSLSPRSAPAYSMLGLLWERTGNIPGAIASYEKVVELAPDSMLERESLQRLRSQQGRTQAESVFHFDEGELFEGTAPLAEDAVDSEVVASEVSPANASASVVAPAAAATPAVARIAAPLQDASASGVAPMPDSLAGAGLSSTPPAAMSPGPPRSRAVAGTLPAIDTVNFTPPATAPQGFQQWWQMLLRQPSFYWRGLPLMAATVISLGFLLWARGRAAERAPVVVPPSTRTTINNVIRTPEDTGAPAVVTNNPDARVGANGASPAPDGSQAGPNAAGSTVNNTPATGNDNTGNDNTGNTTGSVPNSPAGRTIRSTPARGPVAAPAFPAPRRAPSGPVLPSVRSSDGTVRDAEGLRGMPAPRIAPSAPRAADPIRIEPPAVAPPASTPPVDSGAASPGGAPLNPSGSQGRGYIRILPPRSSMSVVPPTQPAQVARVAERAASAAARAGNPDRAIARVTASMEGGDTAWRYQQRGLLFLEKGDNARALDDFQTAIAAYRDRVRRGERVAEAQAGIRACLSGRRIALANMER
ncbi:MAG TPA: tetratricopeptide repeat protein [Abditibacteriaceae bacterium]|nr:tetratricopeptide repeat protein [Abditibacteriaceae bacterium]